MASISDNLFGAIEAIVDQVIEATPIDLTVTAKIVAIRNIKIGEYKAEYQGDIFSVFSNDLETAYAIGKEVYVLVPKGDFSSKKTILGLAEYGDTRSYAEQQEMFNQWEKKGPNWVSNEWYRVGEADAGIIAVNPQDIVAGRLASNPEFGDAAWRTYLYRREIEGLEDLQVDEEYLDYIATNEVEIDEGRLNYIDDAFRREAAESGHIMIRGDFETTFSSVHTSGDYGVLVECLVENPKYSEGDQSEPKYKITTLKLSCQSFNGTPYAMVAPTPQQGIFEVPEGLLKGLLRVSLYQDTNWQTDVIENYGSAASREKQLSENNIFVSNLEIFFCERAKTDEDLFRIQIEAERGTSMWIGEGAEPGQNRVVLNPRVFYGSSEVTSDDACEFKWFREKYDATGDTVAEDDEPDWSGRTWYDYSIIGGEGWIPIEKLLPQVEEDEEETEEGDYVLGEDGSLTINIEAVPVKWRYKVVCIYNSIPTNDPKERAENRSKEHIVWKEETVENLSSGHSFELPPPLYDESGRRVYLRAIDLENPWRSIEQIKVDTFDGDKDLWCKWFIDSSSRYVNISGNEPTQGKFEITNFLSEKIVTFKAQIFNGPNPDAEEIAQVERTINVSDKSSFAVTFQGLRTFNYDASGNLRLEYANQNYSIWPRIKTDKGAAEFEVKWLTADGQEIPSGQDYLGKGVSPLDSLLRSLWVDKSSNGVHFNINPDYDIRRGDVRPNTLILRLEFADGEVVDTPCPITFTKDGEQGTQGTEWRAQVWPTNDIETSAVPAYSERLTVPQPLLVTQVENGQTRNYSPVAENSLFLRTFITRQGLPLSEFKDRYKYRIVWRTELPLELKTVGDTSFSNIAIVMGERDESNQDSTIEVKWKQGSYDLAALNCSFVISAEVQVFEEMGGGQDKLVASINSLYPVDIALSDSNVFPEQSVDFTLAELNWPQFVKYSPSGYDPIFADTPLSFKYLGEALEGDIKEPDQVKEELIRKVQTIQKITRETEDGKFESIYYYRPANYFIGDKVRNGVISTVLPVVGGNITYIRPVIFYLDNYGNTDINAWDGQFIEIGEGGNIILAPTVGAGYKNDQNKFTGVVMGIDTSQKKLAGSSLELYSSAEINRKEYMTGLYGYQEGAASFGIMENGTAFFGRADKGGRIVIDGTNAQLYGGGDIGGEENVFSKLEAKMTNRMRISLLDAEAEGIAPVNGFDLGGLNFHFELDTLLKDLFGFEEKDGHSSPAIEVGEYNPEEYEVPRIGLETLRDNWTSIKNIEIPGKRRFMVTYDGTMYAMNALIKGNIIGSNIIGSNFFNGDGSYAVFEGGDLGIGSSEHKQDRFSSHQTEAKDWPKNPPVKEDKTVEEILFPEGSEFAADFERYVQEESSEVKEMSEVFDIIVEHTETVEDFLGHLDLTLAYEAFLGEDNGGWWGITPLQRKNFQDTLENEMGTTFWAFISRLRAGTQPGLPEVFQNLAANLLEEMADRNSGLPGGTHMNEFYNVLWDIVELEYYEKISSVGLAKTLFFPNHFTNLRKGLTTPRLISDDISAAYLRGEYAVYPDTDDLVTHLSELYLYLGNGLEKKGVGEPSADFLVWLSKEYESTSAKIALYQTEQGAFPLVNYDEGNFRFFVSRDGVVLADKAYIGGGEISINNFIVNEDGIFNFGTTYLIGEKTSGNDTYETAVEGWGGFKLRGEMINLGDVYLGGSAMDESDEADEKLKRRSPFGIKTEDFLDLVGEGEEIPGSEVWVRPLFFKTKGVNNYYTAGTWELETGYYNNSGEWIQGSPPSGSGFEEQDEMIFYPYWEKDNEGEWKRTPKGVAANAQEEIASSWTSLMDKSFEGAYAITEKTNLYVSQQFLSQKSSDSFKYPQDSHFRLDSNGLWETSLIIPKENIPSGDSIESFRGEEIVGLVGRGHMSWRQGQSYVDENVLLIQSPKEASKGVLFRPDNDGVGDRRSEYRGYQGLLLNWSRKGDGATHPYANTIELSGFDYTAAEEEENTTLITSSIGGTIPKRFLTIDKSVTLKVKGPLVLEGDTVGVNAVYA